MTSLRNKLVLKDFLTAAHKFSIFFIPVTVWMLGVVSCSKDSTFTLGENFIEPKSKMIMVDTFDVSQSTVIVDSIISSGTGLALCGKAHDDNTGDVTCSSFFQITLSDVTIGDNEVYDSTVFLLMYSGYWSGDTTKPQSIYIHRLTENISSGDNSYLYNVSSFSYNSDPIGEVHFTPYPTLEDTLWVRMDDSIGANLIEMIRDKAQEVSNSTSFINYFKGLVITPGSENTAVLGFRVSETTMWMRMYTHIRNDHANVKYHDLPMANTSLQFNKIVSNRSSSLLSSLIQQREAVPSNLTNNETFLQGGVGIVTKFNFPSLNELLLLHPVLLRADLIVKPASMKQNEFFSPDSLVLYATDKHNSVITLYNSEGSTIYGALNEDVLYDDNTTYSFDITDFIIDQLRTSYFDPNTGLLIALPSRYQLKSVNKLIFKVDKDYPKLRLYYAYYLNN